MNKDILKQRIVGSIALVSFFVILIPIILEYKESDLSKKDLSKKSTTSDEVGSTNKKSQNKSIFVIPAEPQEKLNNSEYLLQELNEKLARSKSRDAQNGSHTVKSKSWIIQFSESKRSDKFYDKLILDGYFPRKISQTNIESDLLLVRLGPFDSKQKATEILEEIEVVYQIKGVLVKVIGATE